MNACVLKINFEWKGRCDSLRAYEKTKHTEIKSVGRLRAVLISRRASSRYTHFYHGAQRQSAVYWATVNPRAGKLYGREMARLNPKIAEM